LADVVSEFLQFLADEMSASPATIAAYRTDLRQLDSFLTRSLGDHWWELAEPADIQQFLDELGRKAYADTSVARKTAAIRSFFGYLEDRGTRPLNPTATLDVHWPPRVPKMISAGDVEALLDKSLYESATWEPKRDRAMLEMLYATGMRVTELLGLNIADVHVQGTNPHVRRRARGKETSIPLHAVAVRAFRDYLNNVRPLVVTDASQKALFVNRRGERLTRQGFWLIVKGYAKSAGLSGKVSPEILRHSFVAHREQSR